MAAVIGATEGLVAGLEPDLEGRVGAGAGEPDFLGVGDEREGFEGPQAGEAATGIAEVGNAKSIGACAGIAVVIASLIEAHDEMGLIDDLGMVIGYGGITHDGNSLHPEHPKMVA